MGYPTNKPKRGYVGWEIPESDIVNLKNIFNPSYPRFFGHHCTLKFGVLDTVVLPVEIDGYVIGEVNRDGVQALVLMIGGDINRPDGGLYHITWSLDSNHRPVDSNTAIAVGWQIIDHPIYVNLVPKFFPMGQ